MLCGVLLVLRQSTSYPIPYPYPYPYLLMATTNLYEQAYTRQESIGVSVSSSSRITCHSLAFALAHLVAILFY